MAGAAPDLDAAREAAHNARRNFGVQPTAPIPDVLLLVEESAGVPVSVLELDEGVAGAYVVRRGQPFVFVNGADVVSRQRFTLAHELGHHWLEHPAVVDGEAEIEGRSSDPREQEAHAFSGEFLMPGQAIQEWLEDQGDPEIDVEVLVLLADAFGMSAPAALVRLEQTDVLERLSVRRRLRREINQGLHRGAERGLGLPSFDDELARVKREAELPRLPGQLRDNALEAYRAGMIDLEQLAATLRRDVDEVRRLVDELGIGVTEAELDL